MILYINKFVKQMLAACSPTLFDIIKITIRVRPCDVAVAVAVTVAVAVAVAVAGYWQLRKK